MGLKSISVVLFGLALCCFLQSAQADFCQLKLWYGPALPDTFIYTSGEGSIKAPFVGWYMIGTTYNASNFELPSANYVEKASSYCDYCTMTAFSKDTFKGTSQVVDFRTRVGDNSKVILSFSARSYTFECFPPQPEEEEEEDIYLPEEEEVEYEEAEEVEEEEEVEYEEEEVDRSGDFPDAEFQQMNEGDGETLPHWIVELRHRTSQTAVKKLVSKASIPAGKYTTEKIFSTELATNYESLYRFNVQVRDESGVEYRIWFTVYSASGDLQRYWLVNAGYKENRIGEFTHAEFEVLELIQEETSEYYPVEVEELGKKSVNQAAARLQAKGILPQGNYSFFIPYYYFDSIEHSAIINMTEYPDHNGILYRFNGRVIDQSGVIFRVWTIIATNYETPEYYELIDYDYKMTSLDEFTFVNWMPMSDDEEEEEEGGSISDAVKDMRSRSVAQSVPRLQAEGALPEGKYTIAKTYETERAGYWTNPNIPYYQEDNLYKFNVQLVNEAGARFRVTVAILHNYRWQEHQYELIDYLYVENRLDEFTNTNFRSLNEGDLQTESINQAVDHLKSKSVLPQGTYTISKTFPTEFSANFEHPDYSTDDYILYKFTAQVKNAAKTEYKVYAIVITAYDAPQDFELIDYGKIDA